MSFRNKAILWEYTPALRVLIPLVAGVILYDQWHSAIPVSGTSAVVLTLALAGIYAIAQVFKIQGRLQSFLLQLIFVWMGIVLCYAGDDTRHPHWMGRKATSSQQQLMGIIRQQPQQKNYTVKMEIAAVAVLGQDGAKRVSGNALVYLYKTKDQVQLNKGDTVLIPHQWEPVKSTGSPFGLNYPQYCRRKQIHLQQFTDHLVVWGRQNPSALSIPEKLRQRSLDRIRQYIRNSATAALLEAMLMGDERNIDPDMRQAYADTGIIHVVSISGAHIAILFFAISFGFSRLGLKKYARIRYAGTIVFIWFYITIVGMPVPAIRAAAMFTLLAVGNIINRQHNPLNQLFVTATAMLLIQPMWLFSIGFQLSFTAVLSLVLFYRPLLALWPVQNKVFAFFVQTIAASIAAEILVAPLVAYYFHSFPLMFIVANLFAGLTMSLILCLGMLLLLLGKISFIAQALATVIVALSGAFHQVIRMIDKVDLVFFRTIFISPLLLAILYLLICAACMLRKSRAALWVTLCCLLAVSTLTFARALQVHTQKRLAVFQEKGRAHAELLQGSAYHLLHGAASEAYSVQMAHIALGTSRQGASVKGGVLLINDRRIVLADSVTIPVRPFPADILLVVSAATIPDTLLKYCTPGLVVCAAGSRAESAKWEKACREKKVAFHSVRVQGAFIFP